MSAGVLVPPVKVVVNKYNFAQQNATVIINSICMFSPYEDNKIDFALLGGHSCSWIFNNTDERDSAMQGIYDQLGVIE